MSVVPVIDIAAALAGNAEARRKTADEIAHACETVGFFMITGHGVPQAVIDAVDEESRRFFDLPEEEKQGVAIRPTNPMKGYRRVGISTLDTTQDDAPPPDLRESFVMGAEAVPGDPFYTDSFGARFFQPNLWPAEPAGFRPAYESFYKTGAAVARELMRLFALALQLPENFFDDKIAKHNSALNVNHYPKQAVPPVAGQLRSGAHTDYGSLTILSTDTSPGGLQVWVDEKWQDVMPVPGAFIINLGDLMAQWTNLKWRSTLHRVVNPPQDIAATTRRISIVFFHQPNYDAEIACIPSCLDPGEQPKFAPTTAGKHLMDEISKTYSKTPKTPQAA